jgi:hypothetical protein
VARRVYGLALGYEDLNDHEESPKDPCWRCWWRSPIPSERCWQEKATSEDPDEERVGIRRSDQSRLSFLARIGPFRSRTRCPDLPVGRSDLTDAKGYRECDSARWFGRLSMKRSTSWSPDAFRFLLEGRARGVSETDLTRWGAKFGNPAIFVSLVEWADRIIVE